MKNNKLKFMKWLKFFVGYNFRHLEKNSSLLANKVFTDKVFFLWAAKLKCLEIHMF